MENLWNTVFYEPLYNALIFLTGIVPDIGIAVVVLTVLVKIILYPFQTKSIKSQIELKQIQPEIDKIKEKFPNKEDQARETFALYKERKINPFSGCLLVLVQIPIIIALYQVFIRGLLDHDGVLYSFVSFPESVSTMFLGLVDISQKSIIFAVLAGVTQFFQARMSLSRNTVDANDKSFKGEFMRSMNVQVKYILPVFVGVIAYQVSGAVALYWTTSNLFGIFHEWRIRKNSSRK